MEEALSSEALAVVERVKTLSVVDGESYKSAADLWKGIRELRKKVSDAFSPIIKQAHMAHRTALAKQKEADMPLKGAEWSVKQAMSDYDLEQIRKKQEEERRLREIARKEEEEKRLKAALEAEEKGDKDLAEKIIETEPKDGKPIVQKDVPKVEGGPTFQTRWDFEITDEKLIPREFLTPDLVKIRKRITLLKEESVIPGVKVFSRRV